MCFVRKYGSADIEKRRCLPSRLLGIVSGCSFAHPSAIEYPLSPYLLEGVGGVEGLYGLRKIWERLMPRVLDYVICNEIRSHISLRLDTAAA